MYDYQFDSTEEIDLIDYSYNIFKNVVGIIPNLKEFIYKVSTLYNDNYFHNFEHAVNVLHMTFILLNDTHLISKLDKDIKFGLLLGALCHDIDHPGNTNFYEIYTNSERAKLYNNKSVLENYHCKVTFDQLDIFFNQIWKNDHKIKNHYLIESKSGYFFKYTVRNDKYNFLAA